MGRGRDYFYNEASKICNARLMPNEQEMRKLAYELGGDHSKPLVENLSCTKEEANQLAQGDLFEGL